MFGTFGQALKMSAVIAMVAIVAYAAPQKTDSPTQAALSFYRALREKRYADGFRQSVYRNAIEGLSAAELKDLEPDFARTFSGIPEKIEPRGEQITGDTAMVLLKFDAIESLEQVSLIKLQDEWIVGDQESLELVNAQGRAFFFNARMSVNEVETVEILQRIIGAEVIYSGRYGGRNATLAELIKLNGVPRNIEDSEATGYRFALVLSDDKKSFFATASPTAYGKTGRLSFYADVNGIRAEDLKGEAASVRSPIYQAR